MSVMVEPAPVGTMPGVYAPAPLDAASAQEHNRILAQIAESNERIATSLRVLLVMTSGMFGFDCLDRLTGGWSVMNTTWFSEFADLIRGIPYFWFIFSMLTWFAAWKLVNRSIGPRGPSTP